MNFMEAVKAMKEGKKVRQSKPNTTNYHFNKYGQITTEQSELMCFTQDYFEATDWEIYEEEDNWNLADNGSEDGTNNRSIKDIKTFIQKTREDDMQSAKEVQDNKSNSLEFYRGYTIAIEDAREHRDKRAGRI